MGRKTNKNDPRLKTLLDRNKDGAPQDDFERDALEGFSMLKNEQEAFDLKAELDDRMEKELSGANKKRSSPVYWLAAASLFLVIGLSVYLLLLRDQTNPSELKELAISSTTGAVAPPPVSSERSLETLAAEGQEPKRNEPAADKEKKKSHQPAALPATPAAGSGGFNQPSPGHALLQEEEQKAPQEMAYAAKADAEGERDKQINADAIENKDEVAKQATAAKKKEGGPSIKRAATQAPEQSKMAPADSYAMASSTGAAALDLNTGNCYYDGGDARLQKELTQKLEIKKLDKHFEAILFINSKRKVAKVEFTKNENFSPEELKKVTATLQALTNFRFVREPGKGYLCEYKLVR